MAEGGAPAAGPCLRVVRAGILDLLVDGGRRGWERFGMPAGGPADPEAFHLAGLLAGATDADAAIEVTATGPELQAVGGACRVAVACAGDVALTVVRDGRLDEPARQLTTVTLHPGDRIRVGPVRGALRAYVAVAGGVQVAPQLGSRSASLRGGTTGLLARPLRGGDVLPLDARRCAPRGPELELDGPPMPGAGDPLRLAEGPQADRLARSSAALLDGEGLPFRAGAASDRSGLRLEGPALELVGGADVPSQGCPAGALQVTGDGMPILLGPDRGTTGGYAIPAVVIRVDLPRLGRIRPGATVRFLRVDVEAAEAMLAERAAVLRRAAETLRPVA